AITLIAFIVAHIAVHATTTVEMRFGLPLLVLAGPAASGQCARLRMRRYEFVPSPRSPSLFTRRPRSRFPTGFGSRRRRFAPGKRRTERGNPVADSAATRVAQLNALTGSRFVAAYAILILHGTAFGYT